MPVLNTPRAGRNQEGYLETLIMNMYSDPRVIYKNGYGVCCVSPEAIVNAFNAVRNVWGVVNDIKVHYVEVLVEFSYGAEETIRLAEKVISYLGVNGFQSFYSFSKMEDGYLIAIAINSTSYLNGSIFHDNNKHYAEIYMMVSQAVPNQCGLDVSEAMFFDPKVGKGNYVHGEFV